MNIPTLLTLLRILIIPIIILFYYIPFQWSRTVAVALFALACLTDWLDGFLARRYSQMTTLGAFLDPIADKLLVAMVLVIVVGQHFGPLLAIPAAVIVGREVAVSGLREWMAEMGKRTHVAVTLVAKIKTAMQMVALGLLLWYLPADNVWFFWVGIILIWAAAVLTLWSMSVYLKLAWPDLTLAQEKE